MELKINEFSFYQYYYVRIKLGFKKDVDIIEVFDCIINTLNQK